VRPLFGRNPRWVVHPAIVAAAYVLSTALASDVTPAGYVRPLIASLVFAALLTIICSGVTRNHWDGALLATVIIAVLVSPASLAWAGFVLRDVFGPSMGIALAAAALIATFGLVGIRFLDARRQGLPLPRPAPETMNLLSVALVAAVIGSSVVGRMTLSAATPVPPPKGWYAPPSKLPDIVMILLDGYPRSDVLDRRLGTDDSGFLNQLRQRGFDVAVTNFSNYTLTQLTLPSMFQLRYIDQIPSLRPNLDAAGHDAEALRDAAEAGQAFSILRAAGYEVIMSASGWEQATYRRAADRLLDTGELTDLEESLLHRTWLLYVLDTVWPTVFTSSQRNRIVHSFDALDGFPTEREDHPRFLFLHVPAPHLPLVLLADGAPTALTASRYEGLGRLDYGMTDAEYTEAWQSEVAYIDDRVLRGVDRLLASEDGREAVIVVLSDHGYGFEARPDDPQARLANLLAARTPHAPHLVDDYVTPVNLLRILFNQYLATDLPLLPNRYFLHGERALDLTPIDDPDQTPADR
jgi:general stress protein CsbA